MGALVFCEAKTKPIESKAYKSKLGSGEILLDIFCEHDNETA